MDKQKKVKFADKKNWKDNMKWETADVIVKQREKIERHKKLADEARRKLHNRGVKNIDLLKELDTLGVSGEHLTDPDYGKVAETQNQFIQSMVQPHVQSFNWFLNQGVPRMINNISRDFELANKDQVYIWFKDIKINYPTVLVARHLVHVPRELSYPSQCRINSTNYQSEVVIKLGWKINGVEQNTIERSIGYIPIMLKSSRCNLVNCTPAQLIKKGEEEQEAGGYFVVNGYERIIRTLLVQRRNYPVAIKRPSWKKKGDFYTEYGLAVRSVKSDNTYASSMVLHFLSTGSMTISFMWEKEEYFIPVILAIKAICRNFSDVHILLGIMRGEKDTEESRGFRPYVETCVKNMLRDGYRNELTTRAEVLDFIGEQFRCRLNLPSHYSNGRVAEYLLDKVLCIHLTSGEEKAGFLIYMIKKLFNFVKGRCIEESPDIAAYQELLLPGHAMQIIFYDSLSEWLYWLSEVVNKVLRKATGPLNEVVMRKALSATYDITDRIRRYISTGSYKSGQSLGPLNQQGLTIVVDRLNHMRFMSHFRSVHRGNFFVSMRSTTPRKLRPESYGFLCPVHTPDGAPCGLLNHLTFTCRAVVVDWTEHNDDILKRLCCFGIECFVQRDYIEGREMGNHMQVLLDGSFVGWLREEKAQFVTDALRKMKIEGTFRIPTEMEICLIPKNELVSHYPGLYLFTAPARMVRPVEHMALKSIEYIGTLEQVYLTLCYKEKEAEPGITTHKELNHCAMFSEVASFTPFTNFNHGCRNLFQCQMAKQTMGIASLNERFRVDNKTYKLAYPQAPLVRTNLYDILEMDDHPIGVNAVVAVMSYAGYDMEDAIIINKASVERGLFDGFVYKTEVLNLRVLSRGCRSTLFELGVDVNDKEVCKRLDANGLPNVNDMVKIGDPLFSYRNVATNVYKVVRYNGHETAYIDKVYICNESIVKGKCQLAKVKLRIFRKVNIGDKFSNRHGQKGVCSFIWPAEDMPFTGDGVVPDIIFNPHGFPSRMTIGMMIELMAGKSAALHGIFHEASPFMYNKDNDPIEYFGESLKKAGYNYHGTEVMYSGISGQPLECCIFTGIIYYQRLRHMVSDKWQVRSIGPVDSLTQQPIGGRKRGGGIRFGEMERDAFIAHGASYLLQDRMMNCSDGNIVPICTECGSILSPVLSPPGEDDIIRDNVWKCTSCSKSDNPSTIGVVYAPHVVRLMANLLAGLGIKMKFEIEKN